MVAERHTPKVEAGTKRGGKVHATPSRPLGSLEFAKLNELLVDYEKKWAGMGPMGQAPCKHTKAGKTRVVHVKRKLCRVAEVGGVHARTPLFRVLKKTCGAPTRTPPSMTPQSHADLNAKTLTGKDDRKRKGSHADIRQDVHRQLPPRRVPPSFRLSMMTRKAPRTPPCKRPQSHADLKHTVDELKAENRKLQLTIDELGLDELKAESDKREHTAIQELEQRVHRLMATKRTIDELTEMVYKLKGEIDELSSKWFYAQEENWRLKKQNRGLITQVHELVYGPGGQPDLRARVQREHR